MTKTDLARHAEMHKAAYVQGKYRKHRVKIMGMTDPYHTATHRKHKEVSDIDGRGAENVEPMNKHTDRTREEKGEGSA